MARTRLNEIQINEGKPLATDEELATAMSIHLAELNPHSQYLTQLNPDFLNVSSIVGNSSGVLIKNEQGEWTLVTIEKLLENIKLYKSGTTLQRPIIAEGNDFRFNTDTNWFEGYNGGNWFSLGGTPVGTLFVLDYTVVGAIETPITSILSTLPPKLPNGVDADYSGIWASTLVVPSNNIAITSLTFGNLQGLTGTLSINGLTALSFLNFPAITTVMGGFSVSNLDGLTSVSCPTLTYIGTNFSVGNNVAFPTARFPALVTVDGNFSLSDLAGCTTVNFPLLNKVSGNFSINSLPVCVSINFQNLTEIKGKLNLSLTAAVTNISFSSLERIGVNLTTGNAINIGPTMAGLTTFELSNNLKEVNGSIYINCAMSAVSVDNFLGQLSRLDGTLGTTAFSNKSVTLTGPSLTPSVNGINFKNILINRGCTVITN